MTSIRFIYAPLESESHIRLLNILPGRLASAFVCKLIHVPINQSSRYEALSYVWGEQTQQDTIDCNDRLLDVGKALSSALYRLRLYETERLLWIDAICIDQSNILEKNLQLPLMGRIYQQAEQVIVWLGPETAGCKLALSMIASLIDVYNAHKVMRELHEEEKKQKSEQDGAGNIQEYIEKTLEERTSTKVTRHGLMLHLTEDRCRLPGVTSSKWEYLNAIFDAQWFHRVWTIQEMIVAEKVEVVFGDQACSWEHFFYAAYCMGNSLLPMAPVQWQHTMWLDFNRIHFRDEGSLSLLMLLNECHQRRATDQHDRVYALLGLVANQADIYNEGSLLKPDYGLPVDEVYRRVAVHFLMVQQQPDILRAVYPTRVHEKLPSWVPDWNSARPKPILSAINSWYRAGGDLEDKALYKITSHPSDPNILLITRRFYDTIASIGSCMGPEKPEIISEVIDPDLEYERSRQYLTTHVRCWREWQHLARVTENINYPGTNEPRENAYWRTLIGDCSDDFSKPADDGYRYNYKQWRNHMRRAREGFFTNPTADEWAASTKGEMLDAEAMGVIHGQAGDPYFKSFYNRNVRAAAELCFAVTTQGYFALVSPQANLGDAVCVIPGVKTPLLLRKVNNSIDEHFRLLGACFVHGLMNAEALEDFQESETKKIAIV
jgi:hypothetical protein